MPGLLLALLLVQSRNAESVQAEENWSLEKVVDVLRERENSLSAVSAVVAKRYSPIEEGQKARFQAEQQYEQAIHRFWVTNFPAELGDVEPFPIRERDKSPVNEALWTFLWEAGGAIALVDAFERHGETTTISEGRSSIYFDGHVAEVYGAEQGIVSLRRDYPLPPVMEVLGFGTSYASFGRYRFPYSYVSLPDRLALAHSAGILDEPRTVEDPEHGTLIEFRLQYRLTDQQAPMYGRVSFFLAPNRGLAPLRFTYHEVVKHEDGSFETVATGKVRGEWDQYEEYLPGRWLARSFRADYYGLVFLPSPGPDFRPLLKNGRPVWVRGEPRVDPASTKMASFHTGQTVYSVKELSINESVSIPEPPVYPVGTLIVDDRTNELFQVEGVPASVRNAVKTQLDRATGQPITTGVVRARTDVTLILVVGNVLLLAAIGVLWWLRRRSRA